ncbi:MAG: rod shape-determining protein MreC [bacterium]|nr:rod shape-determining protein MreC [bacterium]
MQRHSRKIIALAVVLLIFLIFQLFFMPLQAAKTRFGRALQSPRMLFQYLAVRASLVENINSLNNENQSLQAQILALKEQASILEFEGQSYIRVRSYSNYPFNNKNQILIAAGSASGLRQGQAVLFQPGIFIGEVDKVDEKRAEIRTIFDFNWELPVKIGEEKVDGLLIGGHTPTVTLISKSKNIQLGDPITLASPNFPIGLTVGVVNEVLKDRDDLFQEVKLRFPYNPAEINYLYIPKS